jgi:hypothetical protein
MQAERKIRSKERVIKGETRARRKERVLLLMNIRSTFLLLFGCRYKYISWISSFALLTNYN